MDERRAQLSGTEVSEQDLPGIGRRYAMGGAEGESLTVVIHHSGRRDLYVADRRGSEPTSATLTDTQARTLGAILGGAYFKPAVVEEIEAAVGELLIDWVTLRDGSPAVGRSIADLGVRQQTGMTVAAVVRDHETIVAPEPSEVLRAADRLVVLGRREDLGKLNRLLVG